MKNRITPYRGKRKIVKKSEVGLQLKIEDNHINDLRLFEKFAKPENSGGGLNKKNVLRGSLVGTGTDE